MLFTLLMDTPNPNNTNALEIKLMEIQSLRPVSNGMDEKARWRHPRRCLARRSA